jgi:hypothetical protein
MNSNDWQYSWETTSTYHTPLLNVTMQEGICYRLQPSDGSLSSFITKGIETGPHGE